MTKPVAKLVTTERTSASLSHVQALRHALALLVQHLFFRLGEVRVRDLHAALAQRQQTRLRAQRLDVGAGEVIRGWDEGLRGMCVGEQRKLTIPSDLGYGASGAGDDIPGGATLQFDVELLGFS